MIFLSYGVMWVFFGVLVYTNLPTRYTIGYMVPTIPYLAAAKLKKITAKQPIVLEKEIQATELFNQSPVLIMAVRRPGCAFCRKQASLLNSLSDTLQSRGVRLIAVFHETLGVDRFWPNLQWDLYFDVERRFYGPKERWLPLWHGALRLSTYWHKYKTTKSGFKGDLKGEGRLLGGMYLIHKKQLLFAHLEEAWGDEVNMDALKLALSNLNKPNKMNNTMHKITIYTTKTCPYCIRAKALLQKKNLLYEEINVEDEAARAKMIEKTGGKRSVPQIFVGNQYIGGCDDLYALDQKGKLDELVS